MIHSQKHRFLEGDRNIEKFIGGSKNNSNLLFSGNNYKYFDVITSCLFL